MSGLHAFLARLIWLSVLFGVTGFALMLRVRLRIEDTYSFQVWFRYPPAYIMREMTSDTERRMQWVGGFLLIVVAIYFVLFVLSALVVQSRAASCAA
jgi:hypothetical protein